MEKIFKALSDRSRRKILDSLKNNPGMNVNELTELFSFSRYAVMKHIKILEEANLLVAEKQGRQKKLYLNAFPIRTIYDRWISGFSKLWTSKLSEIKYQLEMEEKMSGKAVRHIYVTYIKAPKEKVWDAVISRDITPLYYFGTGVISNFKPGEEISYVGQKEGKEWIPVKGEIIEFVPETKLVHTFHFSDMDDPETVVTYKLENERELTKLTIIHENFPSENESFKSAQEGWPVILSGLKTLLETGRPL